MLHLGHSEKDAKDIHVEIVDEEEGGISFFADPDPKLLRFTDGECEVWMRTIEYQSPKRQSHVLNMMGLLRSRS
jgi:hypothetical protein